MNFSVEHLYGVVMAGGRGERFWPAGRHDKPKQLLALLNEHTLIEETVQRLFPMLAPERILVVTNTDFVEAIRALLPIPPENVIGEPAGRDTAPCVALATALLERRDPDATMVLLPADHVIRPAKVFQDTLLSAARQAQDGSLVTLGVTPTYPATGYGYIHAGELNPGGFRSVLGFKEKPAPAQAEEFFHDGNYKWNSGIFIWRASAIAEAFRLHSPQLSEKLDRWRAGGDYRLDFGECEKISIDYAVMEKAAHVLVGDAPFYWNDIGSWSALRSVLPPDAAGNVTRGEVLALDTFNSVLLSDADTLLGVIGLRDVAVIKAGNGMLVCPLSEEQRVKELVRCLRRERPEFL